MRLCISLNSDSVGEVLPPLPSLDSAPIDERLEIVGTARFRLLRGGSRIFSDGVDVFAAWSRLEVDAGGVVGAAVAGKSRPDKMGWEGGEPLC